MSQVGMARRSEQSCAEWSYVRLIAGGSQTTDTMITETIGPLIKRARSLGAQHWSFTRTTAPEQPALHVRVFGPQTLTNLFTTIGFESSTDYWSQGDQFSGACEYTETEELDELSSDLALWALSSCPQVTYRHALGVLLLHDGARTLLSGAGRLTDRRRSMCSWSQFWDYQQSCSTEAPEDPTYSLDVLRLALQTLRNDPVTTLWRTRWRLCFDRSLTYARAHDVPHTPQRLTLIHTNLVLNRLGLEPCYEAHLGRSAALLSDDLLHHTISRTSGE